MSTKSDTPKAFTVSVQKSNIDGLLSGASEVGLDGEYIWPIPPRSLALLYEASAEHCRAINVKAESAFGGGMIGASEKVEALCETGTADLFTQLDLDQETFGNAFLQVIRSSDGERIVGLRRLPAITMSRYRGGFLQRATRPDGTTKKITFTADEMIHLRVNCPKGRRYSQPSWIGVHGMLELAHAATRYNASFFKNNALPEYAVIFKGGQPSAAQKEAIRDFFRNEYQGVDNAHRTLVLTTSEENTVEIKQLTADVKDGDFLKLIDAARDRMPVAHGVPTRILGIMTAGQLGGGGEVQQQLFIFEHTTLKPKRRRTLDQLRPLLAELGLKPGDPDKELGPNEVAFKPLDLTPPKDDTESLTGLAQSLASLVQAGVLTTGEAREILPFWEDAAQRLTETPEKPVTRSAPKPSMNALVALLAQS